MSRIKFNLERVPDAGIALGGHCFSEDFGFSCDQQVAALKFTVRVDDEDFICWLTRDEAFELSLAISETLCDG